MEEKGFLGTAAIHKTGNKKTLGYQDAAAPLRWRRLECSHGQFCCIQKRRKKYLQYPHKLVKKRGWVGREKEATESSGPNYPSVLPIPAINLNHCGNPPARIYF